MTVRASPVASGDRVWQCVALDDTNAEPPRREIWSFVQCILGKRDSKAVVFLILGKASSVFEIYSTIHYVITVKMDHYMVSVHLRF